MTIIIEVFVKCLMHFQHASCFVHVQMVCVSHTYSMTLMCWCLVCFMTQRGYLRSVYKCGLSPGPNDLRVQWHVNGRRLELSVMEHRHALSHDAVLVSSWIKEKPLNQHVQYECTAVSAAGNDGSKIDLWPNSMGKTFFRPFLLALKR